MLVGQTAATALIHLCLVCNSVGAWDKRDRGQQQQALQRPSQAHAGLQAGGAWHRPGPLRNDQIGGWAHPRGLTNIAGPLLPAETSGLSRS